MPLDLSCDFDACCELWEADGRHLAENLALDMAGCLSGCNFQTVVTFDQPLSARGDFIAAFLDRTSLVTAPGARSSSAIASSPFPMYRHDWQLILSVSGFPHIRKGARDEVIVPSLEEQARAGSALISIGEKMWRSLIGRALSKTLLPSDRGCTNVVLTSLDRMAPGSDLFAGQAGWKANLSFVAPTSVSRVMGMS